MHHQAELEYVGPCLARAIFTANDQKSRRQLKCRSIGNASRQSTDFIPVSFSQRVNFIAPLFLQPLMSETLSRSRIRLGADKIGAAGNQQGFTDLPGECS